MGYTNRRLGKGLIGKKRRIFSATLFPVRLVEMLARRQLLELFKVLGAQWLGNHILLTEPFAQVDQPATFGTEWAIRRGKPIAGFLARGALDCSRRAHLVQRIDWIQKMFNRRVNTTLI